MSTKIEVGSEWKHRKYTFGVRKVLSLWTDSEGRQMVTYSTKGGWDDSMTERGFTRNHTPVEVIP